MPEAWSILTSNNSLYTRDVRNISVINMTFGHLHRGDCSFAMKVKTRVSQTIDLRLYSLLMDTGQAVFTASALMGCDVPGNNAYLGVSAHRSDGLIQGQRLYLSKSIMDQMVLFLHTIILF